MVEKNIQQDKNGNDGEREVYKVIQGKFNYGGKSKMYGLFFLLFNSGPTLSLEKLDLAINNQKDIDEIGLKLSSRLFVEALKEAKEKEVYKSQKLITNLKNSIGPDELKEIKRAMEDNELEKLAKVFKEKLEDSFQEQTKVKTEFTSLAKEEVKSIYPSLFSEKDADEEAEENIAEDADDENIDKDEAKDSKEQEAKITFKCSPVISPASGVKAESLNMGDNISVKITDGSETAKRYKSELHGDNGFVNGEVKELLFNKESDRYSISINLKDNIYGELVVGPQVKLAAPNNNREIDDGKKPDRNSGNNDYNKNLIILFGVVGVLLIILIILIGFYRI